MLIGVVFALVAAVGYGLGAVMQTIGARQSASEAGRGTIEDGAPSLESTKAAAQTSAFAVGMTFTILGFAAGATAARMLPLFLSQTLVSANLLVTAVLGASLLGVRLRARDWSAMALVVIALGMLGAASRSAGGHAASTTFHWGMLWATIALTLASLLMVRLLGAKASVPAGAAAGLQFGIVAVCVRVMDGITPFSITALLSDPATWALAIAGAFGFYIRTVSLQLGAVNGSTAAMVVGETAFPGIIGLALLNDSMQPGLHWLGLFGFTLAIGGAVLVAAFGAGEAQRSAEANEVHIPPLDRAHLGEALRPAPVEREVSERDSNSYRRRPPENTTGPDESVDTATRHHSTQ
jgi:drug/metabolite transporter (DMT)-like permease